MAVSEILKNLPFYQVTDVDFINLFTDNDMTDVIFSKTESFMII